MDADCESKLGRFASEMQPVAKLKRSISLLIFELEQATQESKNSWIVWKVKHLKHFLNMLPGVFSLCFERWLALPKYTSGFFQTEDIVKAILLEPQANNLFGKHSFETFPSNSPRVSPVDFFSHIALEISSYGYPIKNYHHEHCIYRYHYIPRA